MEQRKRVLVLASGASDGSGGSGLKNYADFAQGSGAHYEVVAVASNREQGAIRTTAAATNVPFRYFPGPWTAEAYQSLKAEYTADYVVSAGWLKLILGLDPATTINTHPALLSFRNGRFGGPGMYGDRVHEAVWEALTSGDLDPGPRSGFTMHFVIDGGGDPKKAYDTGLAFAHEVVLIADAKGPQDIKAKVRRAEKMFCPMFLDLVVSGVIRLAGDRVVAPVGFLIPKR